jgi:hypothetical protein
MTREIQNNSMCVMLKSGITLWLNERQIEKLKNVLLIATPKFIEIDDMIILSTDIRGIFPVQIIEELEKRKNGEWKCDFGHWHHRGEQCGHNLQFN